MSLAIVVPAWIEEQRRYMASAVAEHLTRAPGLAEATRHVSEIPGAVREWFLGAIQLDDQVAHDDQRQAVQRVVQIGWDFTCSVLRLNSNHWTEVRAYCRRHFGIPLLSRVIR